MRRYGIENKLDKIKKINTKNLIKKNSLIRKNSVAFSEAKQKQRFSL